ncbi:MAG: DUF1016 N-terminal domain-containing protein [Thermoguttaceae bacterium]|jgi:hypothetical protein
MAAKKPRKRPGRNLTPSNPPPAQPQAAERLLSDIRGLIEQARQQVARTVNAAMVRLYWSIGKRIREDILHEQRAEYGEEIVASLSAQLTMQYGRGFGRRSLFRMMQFAEFFPDERIVSALSAQLGWSHFVEILSLDNPLKRDFYAEMCRIERWSVRTLRQKIDRLLFGPINQLAPEKPAASARRTRRRAT